MMNFMERTAKRFVLIRAGEQTRKYIELIGLDNLQTLVQGDRSLSEIWLKSASPEEKAALKEQLLGIVKMGITPRELWEEMARQSPEIFAIMKYNPAYVDREIENLEAFCQEE